MSTSSQCQPFCFKRLCPEKLVHFCSCYSLMNAVPFPCKPWFIYLLRQSQPCNSYTCVSVALVPVSWCSSTQKKILPSLTACEVQSSPGAKLQGPKCLPQGICRPLTALTDLSEYELGSRRAGRSSWRISGLCFPPSC